jgi:hypothetical protein
LSPSSSQYRAACVISDSATGAAAPLGDCTAAEDPNPPEMKDKANNPRTIDMMATPAAAQAVR